MARKLSSCRKQLLCLFFAATSFIFSYAQNPIVTENLLTGNPSSEWDINGAGDLSLQGFATDISVNKGSRINFKINTSTVFNYSIKIYRLGYYQGNGARLITTLPTVTGTVQPQPISDATTGLVDCGNWSVSSGWDVPSTAVSGYYIALLQKTTDANVASHIVFIVRDDASTSDILFQASDATWQAYNNYGGNSLYTGATSFPNGHAAKVSYNRPFLTRNGGGGGAALEDFIFNSEYPMIRFMERNGYNVTYFTNIDAARNGNLILNHKVYMSVGHDEYWSAEQRTNVQNARNAGVHLAFFSGNEVYWKTRWENSTDGSNTAYRTLVCYKEGTLGEAVCGSKCDPNTAWTGLWRDGCSAPGGGACLPENGLTGQISWDGTTGAITIPAAYKSYRLWRNTSVANLTGSQVVTCTAGTLGYEWDWEQYSTSNPSGRMTLSSTTLNGHTHKLSLYRHSSGALVFGAGTIQWAWGLDSLHDRGNAATTRDMQQATVNLFADMGAQPATLMSRLIAATASTDNTAPTCAITSPANGASFAVGSVVTISGTASDAGGGIVAGVEVSVDGGTTWQAATGTTSWTFSWTPTTAGSANIKVRGFDDSGRMSVPGAAGSSTNITVTVTGNSTSTIFQTTDAAGSPRVADSPATLGMKFRASVNGYVTGVRYYKPTGATGTRTGTLWSSTGTKLAEIVFSGETSSGWQQALFGAPVAITANTTYIVSYFTSSGDYVAANPYFTAAVVNGSLRALANGEDGGNGLYVYGTSPTFPVNTYQTSNYWVDIVFTTTAAPDTTPPTVSTVSPINGATSVATSTTVVANFSEAVNPSTVTTTTVQLRNGSTLITATVSTAGNQVTLTPSAALANSTTYNVTITGGSAGVKDIAGNALAANYTWSFTTAAPAPVPSNIFGTTGPTTGTINEATGLSLGMKFRVTTAGYITGVRYYKGTGTTGSHTGTLWSSTGTKLAEAVFINETSSGWQQVLFANPVAVAINTTYVVSYHTPSGQYVDTNPYFTAAVVNGPLRALANGEDGGNGLYIYTSTPAFPTSTYQTSNYWVDIVYATTVGPDTTPPVVSTVAPAAGATGASINTTATVTFNEPINASTVTTSSFELRDAANALVPATVSGSGSQAVLTPLSSLAFSATYTAKIKGGSSGVKDVAGNALANDYTWSFTTSDPSSPPPTDGPGGPILVISSTANPFSRYPVEIMRAQGLNEFAAKDISQVTASDLNNYDVVVLGEMSITAAQATMFTNWVTAGGTFIAFRPATQLSSLLGITKVAGSLSDQYLLVNTASGAGTGIVNQTIQFHGTADLYTLSGATSLATLYSTATTATTNPAVTSMAVGGNGGRAIAFTYDLAKSIVYTRQGNPLWSAQKRDGTAGPIRSDDQYFGAGSPDWIDFNKIAIPQADEQQHLLTNIIIQGNLHRKPLPRFWFLPSGHKAAVVMTGDDHGANGTTGQFNYFKSMGPNTATDVADWKAIRSTSYIYNGTLTNAAATSFETDGFEIGSHINTNCVDVTPAQLSDLFTNYLAFFAGNYPTVSKPVTNRIHCIAWSDWASAAKVEVQNGIRFDVNYYYWPATWVLNRPGMFTGSGMPMRFADMDGTLIDCYQAPTQMTDEAQLSYTPFINALLDKAQGPEGYYGVFTTNMHTDSSVHTGAIAVVQSAIAHHVPVVSSKQMLTWLDGRNNSYFSAMTWNGGQLTFSITALAGARNLQTMLPANSDNGPLVSLTRNGSPVTYTLQTIKGISYAFFAVSTGTAIYVATYNVPNAPPTVTTQPVSQSICSGSPVSFSSAASGNPLPTVKWQQSTDTVNWSDITGATNAVYSFTPAAADSGKKYRAVWTNNQGTANSNAAALSVNAIPATPTVAVVNNCGSSVLTAGNFTGSLLWSTGATTSSITVTTAATYTVTQTINGCTSAAGSGTAAPLVSNVPAPTVSVVNNCGSSVLTAGNFTGSLLWSTGETTTSITVATGATYTVTQTTTGCTSPAGSGVAAPKTVPAVPTISTNVSPNICQGSSVTLTASSSTGNLWSTGATTQSITVNAAGNYTVTTTVNGCSATSLAKAVVVNQPPAGTISSSSTTLCDNSTASVVFNATAGTGPYSVVINGTTYNNISNGGTVNTNVTAATVSLWPNTTLPAVALENDGIALELGMKFRTTAAGTIKSIRFYKGSATDGNTYTVKLYQNSNQALLASQTFTNTTATGWQTVTFATPVSVVAGTTYVAAVYSASGNYAYSGNFFTAAVVNGVLTGLANGTDGSNGVYRYGAGGGFPSSTYQSSNYWVDVVYVPSSVTLTLTSITDANGCTVTGTLGTKTFQVTSCTSLSRAVVNPSQSSTDRSTPEATAEVKDIPVKLGLDQNHPNPFNGTTLVDMHIPKTEKIRLSLYDVNGRLLRVLLDELREAGSYTIPVHKNSLGAGIYYYRLEGGGESVTKKMTIY